MKTRFLLKFIFILAIILMPCFLVQAETPTSVVDDLLIVKKQANNVLYKEIIPNLKVKALENSKEITETNSAGEVVVQATTYTGLKGFSNTDDIVINFSGNKVNSEMPVAIAFNSDFNKTKKTKASSGGSWIIDVPISVLPTGKNLAYVYTEKEGVKSDKVAVASFEFNSEYKVSIKTWYFIIFVALAIITLMFAIILQLRRNARDLEPGQLI